MELYISIKKESSLLQLMDKDRRIDSIESKYHHDLSEILIAGLDTLLRKNIIDIALISSFTLESQLGPDSTAYRIGQSFIEALKAPV